MTGASRLRTVPTALLKLSGVLTDWPSSRSPRPEGFVASVNCVGEPGAEWRRGVGITAFGTEGLLHNSRAVSRAVALVELHADVITLACSQRDSSAVLFGSSGSDQLLMIC